MGPEQEQPIVTRQETSVAPMGGTGGGPALVPWLFALSRGICPILRTCSHVGDGDRDTGPSLAPGRGK